MERTRVFTCHLPVVVIRKDMIAHLVKSAYILTSSPVSMSDLDR